MNNQKHSEEFINEMKSKLQEEEKELNKELASISTKNHGDQQVTPPEYGSHADENASEASDTHALHAVTEATEVRLNNIRRALNRIETGTYGVSEDGELIPADRLQANPAATTLID